MFLKSFRNNNLDFVFLKMKLTFFISFFNGDCQLCAVELLPHGVQDSCHSIRLDESSFALVEHGKSLLEH